MLMQGVVDDFVDLYKWVMIPFSPFFLASFFFSLFSSSFYWNGISGNYL